MTSVPDIIERLGGPAAIARATGFPLTTVDSWKRSGHVPSWRIPSLVEMAKAGKVPLDAEDFPARPTPSQTEAQAA